MYSRATIAQCDNGPPESHTTPPASPNNGVHAGIVLGLAGLAVGLFVAAGHLNGTRRKLYGSALCL